MWRAEFVGKACSFHSCPEVGVGESPPSPPPTRASLLVPRNSLILPRLGLSQRISRAGQDTPTSSSPTANSLPQLTSLKQKRICGWAGSQKDSNLKWQLPEPSGLQTVGLLRPRQRQLLAKS